MLIIQGGQQGLDLTAKLVVDPGDVIITENPTFLGALIAFNPCEPTYAAVAMDDDGMDMDDLERTLHDHPDATMIYTVPDFQNPTGITLSLPRRKRLIELANAYGVLVVEDSPYRELRYAGEHLPTLKSLDTEGRVVHLGSFSKILAPGMRLGWAVASPEILDKLTLLKLAADTQSSTLNMAATSAYLSDYDIDAHIARARPVYRHKRDLMLQTIAEHLPRRHRLHRARRRSLHLADLPGRFRCRTASCGITCCRRPRSRTCRARPSSRSPRNPTTRASATRACPMSGWSAGSPRWRACCTRFEPIARGDLTVTRD